MPESVREQPTRSSSQSPQITIGASQPLSPSSQASSSQCSLARTTSSPGTVRYSGSADNSSSTNLCPNCGQSEQQRSIDSSTAIPNPNSPQARQRSWYDKIWRWMIDTHVCKISLTVNMMALVVALVAMAGGIYYGWYQSWLGRQSRDIALWQSCKAYPDDPQIKASKWCKIHMLPSSSLDSDFTKRGFGEVKADYVLSKLPSWFRTPENIDKQTCYIACAEAPLLPNIFKEKELVVGGLAYIALVLFCFYFTFYIPFLGHNIFSISRLGMLTSELLSLTIFCLFCRCLGLFLNNPGFLDFKIEKGGVFAVIGLAVQPNLYFRRWIGDSKQPIISPLTLVRHWAWKQLEILLIIYSYYFRAQYLMSQLFGTTRVAGLVFALFSLLTQFTLHIIAFLFRNKAARREVIYAIVISTAITMSFFWIMDNYIKEFYI